MRKLLVPALLLGLAPLAPPPAHAGGYGRQAVVLQSVGGDCYAPQEVVVEQYVQPVRRQVVVEQYAAPVRQQVVVQRQFVQQDYYQPQPVVIQQSRSRGLRLPFLGGGRGRSSFRSVQKVRQFSPGY